MFEIVMVFYPGGVSAARPLCEALTTNPSPPGARRGGGCGGRSVGQAHRSVPLGEHKIMTKSLPPSSQDCLVPPLDPPAFGADRLGRTSRVESGRDGLGGDGTALMPNTLEL